MRAAMNGNGGTASVPFFRSAGCPYSNHFHFFTTGPVTTGETPRSGVALVAFPFHSDLQQEAPVTPHLERANPRAPPLLFRFEA